MHSPRVTIGNDGSHVINIGSRLSLVSGHLPSCIPLLAIVHLLRLEETLHLVRDGVVRVIAEIGRHFVGRGEERGTGPAGDIEDFLMRSLLGHLHGIDRAHCR